MKTSIIIKLGVALLFLLVAFDSVGQYRIYDGGRVLAPMPNGGVVVLSTDDGYLSSAVSYDATGLVSRIPYNFSNRVGDFGTYSFDGNQLIYLPGVWQDYDVPEDVGIHGLSVSVDSISRDFFRSPQSPGSFVGSRTIGLSKDGQSQVVTAEDSVTVFSSSGQIASAFELSQVFDRSYTVDLDGVAVAGDLALVGFQYGQGGTSTIQRYSEGGQLLKSDVFRQGYLGSWTDDGRAFVFLDTGYVELGIDTLAIYPSSIGAVHQAYDAQEVAVVRNDLGQYYSFDPDFGFVSVNSSESAAMDYVLKRTEGWYTLDQGILSFNPDSLEVPLTNPLVISLSADSASIYVDSVSSPFFPSTEYKVFYTVQLENTTDTFIPSSMVRILGASGSYNPMDPSSFATQVILEDIGPRETVSLSSEHAYSLSGVMRELRGAVEACIISVNGQRFVGGETSCVYSVTIEPVSSIETVTYDESHVQVYPNPINKQFMLVVTEEISTIDLVNSTGQVVQQFKGSLSQTYQLGDHVSSGLYTLQVSFANGQIGGEKVLISQ